MLYKINLNSIILYYKMTIILYFKIQINLNIENEFAIKLLMNKIYFCEIKPEYLYLIFRLIKLQKYIINLHLFG